MSASSSFASTARTLVLDIGSGTQDVLYVEPSLVQNNWPKFVLPAPARAVAARISAMTAAGRAVYLCGTNMGGGFYRALKAHLAAGLPAAAHPEAAYSLGDDLSLVEKMGVTLSETMPEGHVPVQLADYDAGFWRAFLAAAGLAQPDMVVACAQDHGFHPGKSNREGRFRLWQRFLTEAEGRPEALIYHRLPSELTRLSAVQRAIGGGPVADSGPAAVLGVLAVPEIEARAHAEGGCIVNIGNSHTIAFLVHGGRMWGVYEQHTGIKDGPALWEDLTRFRTGELTFAEVFDAKGHGCMTLDLPKEANGFASTWVIGPQRDLLAGFPVEFPHPGGDMMLAGCFGLLKGLGGGLGGFHG
ncbi:protein of unknown function DUF1786 putative pyruvate format-lyase activating enzyme [Desulfovibrio sp. X2]|uniref:DUF1786 domain-containing protein n=1 Tax=Desulfovibrio sp. X2 TaxID=941449 RepID=UPI00035882D0|nr:DUF1786 domain-containing protein [Desulfovibrio sp. X2]EPR37399.1 protein of unknown function DUF1786 putative pyruvate format-lyase activating enzyme [Desulfovibrio sp. X2]